jgi:hypothetical protein
MTKAFKKGILFGVNIAQTDDSFPCPSEAIFNRGTALQISSNKKIKTYEKEDPDHRRRYGHVYAPYPFFNKEWL